MNPRLRSELRIKAFLRYCDLAFYMAVITRRGDPDAGDIIVHQRQHNGLHRLWKQQADGWAVAVETNDADAVEQRLQRAAAMDGDLWIVAMETPVDAAIFWP